MIILLKRDHCHHRILSACHLYVYMISMAETPNLQGTCALVWHTYHVSDDPKGSKYCPQGAILFFSLMPCSSDTLGPRVTKFGTQVEANKGYPSL